MARNSYPHMVFIQPDAGLDKESLTEALGVLFPGANVQDRPLRLDLDLDGYVFSFWFEEAEGVAEMYATYLPEGARRRWLSRCEAMIDFHGAPDANGTRAGDAEQIVAAMYDCDGVEVFSEEAKRFLGMDYGDEAAATPEPAAAPPSPAAAPVPPPPPAPTATPEPAATPEPLATPEPTPFPAPQPPAPAAPTPSAVPEPLAPAAQQPRPEAPAFPARTPAPWAAPSVPSVPPPAPPTPSVPSAPPPAPSVPSAPPPAPSAPPPPPATTPTADPGAWGQDRGVEDDLDDEKKGRIRRWFARREGR